MPPLKATTTEITPTPANPIGRDEMNLAEYPLTVLTDTVKAGQKTLYFESGHGRLTVTGSDAYGLPTASDADVLIGLQALTKLKNNFTEAKVNFTKYELLKIIGWPNEGDSYKRLDQSFNRWGGVWLVYDKCWWDNKRRRFCSAKMHIIESVMFLDADGRHRDDSNDLPLSTFTWNQTFIESCQHDNLRSLDLDVYRSLRSSLSKRLYRFLGKRFYRQSAWTFDLKDLAFEHVGLSRSYQDAGKIKEKLKPALSELEALGFLEPLDRVERYRKVEKGQWTIRLSQKAAIPPAAPVVDEPKPSENPLIAELVSRGVTRSSAETLAVEFPAESIRLKIEEFDYLLAKNDPKVAKSPSGYLFSSIRGDYASPKGFVSQAEQVRRQEVKEAKARVAAEERRHKAQADAAERAELAALDGRIEAMTHQERKAAEAAALEAAGESARTTYQTLRTIKAGAGYLRLLTREYLRTQSRFALTSEPA